MENRKNISENIKCAILAFLTSTSLCINNNVYIPTEAQMENLIGRYDGFFWKANASFQQTSYLICMVGLMLFFAFKYLNTRFKQENLKWYIPIGAICSFIILLGVSYHQHNSWEGLFGSFSALIFAIVKGIGIAILFVYLLDILQKFSITIDESRVLGDKGQILKYTLLFLFLWIPYMIILFPGCTNPDTTDQVAQILGNYDYSWTAKSIILNDESIILNNHHPVFYTAIIAIFVKLGGIIGSYNFAFELYCVIQSAILAFSLSCQVYYISNTCKNKGLQTFSILFFGLNPLFPIWGMTVMKDVLFSILLWWIIILLYKVLKCKNAVSKKQLIALGIIIFIWCLIRNNGFYIFMVLLPFVMIYLWKDKQKLIRVISMLLVVMVVFQVGVQNYIFSSLNISSGSPREMLSVPFMQTARYIREHKEEISEDEEAMLLTLFDTPNDSLDDIIEKYNATPAKSDKVKNMYNKETDSLLLKNYFKFWLKGLLKHPSTYIQAFLCLNYGWITIEGRHDNRYYNGITDSKISNQLEGLSNPEGLKVARNILSSVISVLAKIPFTSWLVEFSFYTWTYLILLILKVVRKKKTEILAMSPLFINYLICFLGPVAYMRYAVPAAVCLPTLILFTFGEERKEINEKNSGSLYSVLQ